MRRRPRRMPLVMTPARRARLVCLLAAVVLTVLVVVGSVHLKDLLGNLAVTRVSNTVGQVVTRAVEDTILNGEISYETLISFEKDNEGRITALSSNMAEFNRLQAAVTQDILKRLEETAETSLSIPLGTLTGAPLLVGRGPRFTVRMETVGSCSAHFENQFDQAGINQTTHRILLEVDVSVSILLPGFRTYTSFSHAFSVAETVIVGAVPDTYTYFDSGNPVEEDAFEYSINNG